MTEQIANQNVLLLAEIANLPYEDGLAGLQSNITSEAGFTHIAPSTPNYNPYSWVDEFGNLNKGQVYDGFNGQSFYCSNSKLRVRAAALFLSGSA